VAAWDHFFQPSGKRILAVEEYCAGCEGRAIKTCDGIDDGRRSRPNTSLPEAAGHVAIGDEKLARRPGFGAMRVTGAGIWGSPPDPAESIKLIRHAVRLGVNFFDTADSYGPFISEELIARALYPYDGVVVATKGGLVRTGPGQWHPLGRPEYLRQCVEMSLRRLRAETIDLYQLHRIDPLVPLADQLGALDSLRHEGKISNIGMSEASVKQVCEARLITTVASVQNRYNLADRESENLLRYCEREGLAFISWAPLAAGRLAAPDGPLIPMAKKLGVTPSQLALAWLLRRSAAILPIPGTNSLAHLDENVASARLVLTSEQNQVLSGLAA
jgi:pyridoxine 4-dehydrogenase